MKKIFFLLLLGVGAANIAQAQFLNDLKTKAKTAVNNSVDRTTNKIVDKTINKPADDVTDTTLDRAGKKWHSLFKKKNKNKPADGNQPAAAPQTDTIAIKPPDQN